MVSKLIIIIGKMSVIPIIFLITYDKQFIERANNDRFTTKDYLIHLSVLAAATIFYILLKYQMVIISDFRILNILPELIKFQGVLLAASIAVTTFILNTLRGLLKAEINLEKRRIIDEIIGDLKLTNRIIFCGLIFFVVALGCSSMGFLIINKLTVTILFYFIVWSLIAIDNLIRNVFLFVGI